jgi:hypothetical protein
MGSDNLDVLSRNDLGEALFASPAIADGVMYVRTPSKLIAFGIKSAGPPTKPAANAPIAS